MAKRTWQMLSGMVYSLYYLELDEKAKARYREKLTILGGINDPYTKTSQRTVDNLDWQQWPEVLYPDIYIYIYITTLSPQLVRIYKKNSKHTKIWKHIVSL